jgi:heat shock protein HslJ
MRAPVAVVALLTALAAACTASTPDSAPSAVTSGTPSIESEPSRVDLPGTSWELTYVDGRAWPVGDQREVTLSFSRERLGGFNGCNEYGARWRLAGKRLAVGRYLSTMMGCAGDAAWVEGRIFRILSASPVVSVTSGELRITARPEGVLVFEPA